MDLSLKLFVGQVPKSMEEAELQPYFDKYGPISNVKICRDRDSKQHKGCAFITCDNLDDGERIIREMHDRVRLPGAKKEMQIKPVVAEDEKKFEKRLFIGMISKSLDADELKELFSHFGEITDCNILFTADKSSRGCGFLKFAKPSSCITAIQEMHHSQTMDGCNSPLVVKHADTAADKMKRQAPSAGFDDRMNMKRPYMAPPPQSNYQSQPVPMPFPPQQQQQYQQQYQQQPQYQPPQQNSTAMALINAFTPLLASIAEQNNPGTTKMLVKCIQIALDALKNENTPSAHTALVSIASNLSVAVANNLSKDQSAPTANYNQVPGQPQFDNYDYQNQNQSTVYSGQQPNSNSHHYNYSSRAN